MRKPNKKRERFIELCSMGQTSAEAGRAVGYSEATAEKYRTIHAAEIKEMAAKRWDALAPEAVERIRTLLGARSETVRLSAANRILEGAGMGTIHRSEVTHKTDQQLDDELLQACDGDPKKVEQVMALIRGDANTLH